MKEVVSQFLTHKLLRKKILPTGVVFVYSFPYVLPYSISQNNVFQNYLDHLLSSPFPFSVVCELFVILLDSFVFIHLSLYSIYPPTSWLIFQN